MTEAVNTFTNGLVMDLHPLTTPNNVLTNCLNGTYITYNGNEMILQNDMGNGRVETAKLPAGYIPVGVVSHGGIIYVASYNPIEKMSQIGCFPSPERNISSLDSGRNDITFEPETELIENILGKDYLKESPIRKTLNLKEVHPGDQFNIPFIPKENWYKTELVSITDSNQILTVNKPEAQQWTYYSSKYPGLLAFQFTPYLLKEFNVTYDINKQGELNLNWSAESENETAPLEKVEVEVYYIAGSFKELFYKNELTEAITINNIDLNHQLNVDITAVDPKVQFIGVRVTPMMKTYNNNYARIRSMSKYFEIEVANIDKNIINLNEYRYKVNLSEERNTLLLSYGFNGDLSEGFEIENSYLKVFDLNNNKIGEISLKKNFGYFTTEISLDDKLQPNHLYVVQFNVELNNNQQPYQTARFLYTSTIFNEHYSIATDTDFGKLHPELTFEPEIKIENERITLTEGKGQIGNGIATETQEGENVYEKTYGYTEYDIEGEFDITINPKVNDSLFNVNNLHYTTESLNSKIETDSSVFDKFPDGVKSVFNEANEKDEIYANFTPNSDAVNINGKVYSKICCLNTITDVEYKYIWTPIVYNEETASKNNIQTDGTGFKCVKFTWLGGYDYSGGTAMISAAVAELKSNGCLYYDKDTRQDLEVGNGHDYSLSTWYGSRFFGTKNTKVCENIETNIIPTILAYSPTDKVNDKFYIKIDGSGPNLNSSYKYKQYYNEGALTRDIPSTIPNFPKIFDEIENVYTYFPILLQIKSDGDFFVPLNLCVLIDKDQVLIGENNIVNTLGDLIFSVLNQIYIRRDASTVNMDKQKQWIVEADNIYYIPRYTKNIKINEKINWDYNYNEYNFFGTIQEKNSDDFNNLISKYNGLTYHNVVPKITITEQQSIDFNKEIEIIETKHSNYLKAASTINQVGFIPNSDYVVGISDDLSMKYGYVNNEGIIVNWDNGAVIYKPTNISEQLGIYKGNYDLQHPYQMSDFYINDGKLYVSGSNHWIIRIQNNQNNNNYVTLSSLSRYTLFKNENLNPVIVD